MISKNSPFISIIFPNWNGKDDVIECLDSLSNLNYLRSQLEVIISDNGSTDGSQLIIKEKFSNMAKEGWNSLLLIENKENLGASQAINIGIKQASPRSKFFWILDNDVIVNENALKELTEIALKSKIIGIVGSINYFFDKPSKIWYSGWMVNWKTLYFKPVVLKEDRGLKYVNVDCVPGCSFLIKRDVLLDIGLYDPTFFLYFNEIDLCLRTKKAGYNIVATLHSKTWHKVSSSTRKNSELKTYYTIRNFINLMKKHASPSNFILFIIQLMIMTIPRKIVSFFMCRNLKAMIFLLKGFRDGIVLTNPSIYKNKSNLSTILQA